jgi:hypothetical protein
MQHSFHLLLGCLLLFSCSTEEDKSPVFDLGIYGSTLAGITAAIQAKRMDKSVILSRGEGHF